MTNVTAADDFFVHDGDRVVFLGDSITEQRLYTTYIEAYALTRYPNWKLTFLPLTLWQVKTTLQNKCFFESETFPVFRDAISDFGMFVVGET